MQKHTKLFGLIFICLLALFAAKLFLPQLLPASSAYLDVTKQYIKNKPSAFTLEKGVTKLSFTREGEKWKLDQKAADSSRIDSLLTGLLPNDAPQLISENSEKQSDFEVTPQLAYTVTFNDSPTFYIGKNASPRGAYVRLKDATAVYLLPDLATYNIATEAAFWYDKTIIAIPEEKLTKITLSQGSEKISIEQKEKVWKKADGSDAPKEKVSSLVSLLSSMLATNFATKEEIEKFGTVISASITIEYDGKSETLELIKGDENYLLKRVSDGEYFMLDSPSAERITSLL